MEERRQSTKVGGLVYHLTKGRLSDILLNFLILSTYALHETYAPTSGSPQLGYLPNVSF